MTRAYVTVDSVDYLLPELVAEASLPFFGDAWYGAVGDGTTDDTTAIQDALDAAGAIAGVASNDKFMVRVMLRPGRVYRAVGLSVPKGVCFDVNGSRIQANGVGTIVTLAGIYATIENACLWGQTTTTDNTAIHVTSAAVRARIVNCTGDALGSRFILCEGVASWIEDCMAQGSLTNDAALATPTGVCELNTTDCWITNCEFTASQTALSASGNAYAVVLKGGTHTLTAVVAEISDHGFYITASRTRLVQCRADLNYGHGFVLAANSGGSLDHCLSLRNGRQTTNTYDGFNFANNTNWRATGCTSECLVAENTHRYGFYDATQSATNFNQFDANCRSWLHGTAAIFVDNASGSKVDPYQGPFLVASAGATTIDVQLHGWPSTNHQLNSSSAVSFTGFTNGVVGQRLTVRGEGFTTFVHSASLVMRSGFNTLAQSAKMYEFVNLAGNWIEVGVQQPQSFVFATGATYTPALTDAEKVIYTTLAGGCAVTIPPNSTHAFPLGTRIDFIRGAAGALTIAAGAGVTVAAGAPLTGTVRAQYSRATIQQITANFWVLSGDLA